MLPPAEALILVTVLPHPRDLEIARLLGWYRIPLSKAPKVIVVDYLAFYQPASFGEKKWRIELCTPVMGHELVTRYELLGDEPNHPRVNQEYFKISIGPLIPLHHAILAEEWKRITFFYTMGEYLSSAATISDLMIDHEQRKYLWKALRERSLSCGDAAYHKDIPELELDPAVLAALLGMKENNNNVEYDD